MHFILQSRKKVYMKENVDTFRNISADLINFVDN